MDRLEHGNTTRPMTLMNIILHSSLALFGFTLFAKAEDLAHTIDRHLNASSTFYNGAVAAEHPKCSEIGLQMLQQGGSAVDSAIAALLCVGVVNNFASGIGGGGSMLIRTGDGQSEVIDFRETAPASAHRDMFNHNHTLATDSTQGAGVPGEIRGFAEAHSRHGRLPWAVLFEPSIQLAREGFAVTPKMADMISKFADKMKKSSGMMQTYGREDGSPKKVGDFIFRSNLAQTLEKIADQGADVFYQGEIGESLAQYVASKEGGFTLEDLRTYTVKIRPALIHEALGFKLITGGLPTCGGLVVQILKVLERLRLDGSITDLKTIQQLVETFKFAYVDRMKLGDPDFIPDADEIVAKIVSDERAAAIVPRIDPLKTHSAKYYFGKGDKVAFAESHGTTHVTVMDRFGMAVSVTSTVNLEWGCRYMDERTGIILNNELDDFSIPHTNNSFGLPPSIANFISPGKRPLSSSSPLILERDGQVVLALGAAGGSRIITAVADMVLKLMVLHMEPVEAMNSCRLHHQLIPEAILAEHRCDRELLAGLSRMGHPIIVMSKEQYASCVNLILKRSDGGMTPVSDPRKGGLAAGY